METDALAPRFASHQLAWYRLCEKGSWIFTWKSTQKELSNTNLIDSNHVLLVSQFIDDVTLLKVLTIPVNCGAILVFNRYHFDTLRPGQNGRLFADDICTCIFVNEDVWISINISPKWVPKGRINNIPAWVQIMAWRRQVVFPRWMQDSNTGSLEPNLQQTDCSLRNRLSSYWGSS